MHHQRSLPMVMASALLGVISAAAIVTAAFLALGAWATSASIDGAAGNVGSVAALLIAATLFGLAMLAGWTARDVWQGRERALPLGLMVSTMTVLGAAATIVAGNADRFIPLLYATIAVGSATMIALLAGARSLAEFAQDR